MRLDPGIVLVRNGGAAVLLHVGQSEELVLVEGPQAGHPQPPGQAEGLVRVHLIDARSLDGVSGIDGAHKAAQSPGRRSSGTQGHMEALQGAAGQLTQLVGQSRGLARRQAVDVRLGVTDFRNGITDVDALGIELQQERGEVVDEGLQYVGSNAGKVHSSARNRRGQIRELEMISMDIPPTYTG